MKSIIFSVVFLISLALNAQDRPIGINLSEVKDWWPQFLFKDAFKQSREWVVQPSGTGEEIWDKAWIDIPKRKDGYPTHAPFMVNDTAHYVSTVLLSLQEYGYPTGPYTLSFEGTGQISLGGDATDTIYTDNTAEHQFTVNPTLNGINISILESDSTDPIHNIKVMLPGFSTNDESNPFHPKILELLEPFHNIRYMPVQEINAATIEDWDDRATKDYYTQGDHHKGGIATEYIIELANITGKDLWINIPATASDSFVIEYAQMISDGLTGSQHVYLEFGNEIWNPVFNSYTHCRTMGFAEELDSVEMYAVWKYSVKRALECFYIWEQYYTDSSRLSKVLSPQMGWLFVGQQMMSYTEDPTLNPNNVSIDALALAPYFFMGEGYPGDLLGPDYWVSQGWEQTHDVEDLLDSLEHYIAQDLQYLDGYKALADEYNLDLHAYEGGQHLSVIQYEENEAMGALMIAANRHPRMKGIYCDFFDLWYAKTDGGLFNSFDLLTRYDNGGMWGILEYMEQDTSTAPKWMAHVDCVFEKEVSTEVSDGSVEESLTISSFVEDDQVLIVLPLTFEGKLQITDISGRTVLTRKVSFVEGDNYIDLQGFKKGMYILQMKGESYRFVKM